MRGENEQKEKRGEEKKRREPSAKTTQAGEEREKRRPSRSDAKQGSSEGRTTNKTEP